MLVTLYLGAQTALYRPDCLTYRRGRLTWTTVYFHHGVAYLQYSVPERAVHSRPAAPNRASLTPREVMSKSLAA